MPGNLIGIAQDCCRCDALAAVQRSKADLSASSGLAKERRGTCGRHRFLWNTVGSSQSRACETVLWSMPQLSSCFSCLCIVCVVLWHSIAGRGHGMWLAWPIACMQQRHARLRHVSTQKPVTVVRSSGEFELDPRWHSSWQGHLHVQRSRRKREGGRGGERSQPGGAATRARGGAGSLRGLRRGAGRLQPCGPSKHHLRSFLVPCVAAGCGSPSYIARKPACTAGGPATKPPAPTLGQTRAPPTACGRPPTPAVTLPPDASHQTSNARQETSQARKALHAWGHSTQSAWGSGCRAAPPKGAHGRVNVFRTALRVPCCCTRSCPHAGHPAVQAAPRTRCCAVEQCLRPGGPLLGL